MPRKWSHKHCVDRNKLLNALQSLSYILKNKNIKDAKNTASLYAKFTNVRISVYSSKLNLKAKIDIDEK